jgi:hypothetical protein
MQFIKEYIYQYLKNWILIFYNQVKKNKKKGRIENKNTFIFILQDKSIFIK